MSSVLVQSPLPCFAGRKGEKSLFFMNRKDKRAAAVRSCRASVRLVGLELFHCQQGTLSREVASACGRWVSMVGWGSRGWGAACPCAFKGMLPGSSKVREESLSFI